MHKLFQCSTDVLRKLIRVLFVKSTEPSCNAKCSSDSDCVEQYGAGKCLSDAAFFKLTGNEDKRCFGCIKSGDKCRHDNDCDSEVCKANFQGLREGECITPRKAGSKCRADEECSSGNCDGDWGIRVQGTCKAQHSLAPRMKTA